MEVSRERKKVGREQEGGIGGVALLRVETREKDAK